MLICFKFCKESQSASQYIMYVGCYTEGGWNIYTTEIGFTYSKNKNQKGIVSNWSIYAFSLQLSPTEDHIYKALQWPSCLYLFNLHPSESFLWMKAIKYISVLQCTTQPRPLVLQKVTDNGPIMQLFLISVNTHVSARSGGNGTPSMSNKNPDYILMCVPE